MRGDLKVVLKRTIWPNKGELISNEHDGRFHLYTLLILSSCISCLW